ncbi:hypothetical protein NA78x_003702 [Anatilimnocola sp. NA78]|uniref:hypothetical protein n=1 Tax=Anatilimnocola sp. NA78 TaxID=3415683 RepID=UPI003CE49532
MKSLFSSSLAVIAALAVVGFTATASQAEWPRYRVNAGYSMPSAPAFRPAVPPPVPVVNLQPPTITNSYRPLVPTAQPIYASPQPMSSPVTTAMYGQPIAHPNMSANYLPTQQFTPYSYAHTHANPVTPMYNPVPQAAYYAPQGSQTTMPAAPLAQPYQPNGGYYEPTRPSNFYSPLPGYRYQQTFGQY